MTKVIYPGTFDPISYGHIDLVKRGLKLFDKIIIAISTGQNKSPLFTKEARLELIGELFKDEPRVEVILFDGLLVDVIEKMGAKAVLRGLRAVSDFEYEFQMASVNHKLSPNMETIFLTPDEQYMCLSSSMVKEVARIDVSRTAPFVPEIVFKALQKKFAQ